MCLAECLGNSLLADTLRDFTARTTLIAMLYQSSHDAAQSCEDHVQIVAALERGDIAGAEALMAAHIGTVQSALRVHSPTDPLAQLRDALAPLQARRRRHRLLRTSARAKAADAASSPDESSTYLGALL